ncbi:MAG: hypothetical protein JWL95_1391, partial [Gemmatimonadetes bacterium]|nr:hypothetical protein [Gemmatimonadota bacterium]
MAVVAMASPLRAQKKVYAGHGVTSNVSVRLFAAVGQVQVIGWDRDSVQVSGVVATDSHVELGAPHSSVVQGLKLFVEAATEQAGREGTLTLHVPRGARVWVKTGSAH